MTWRPSHACCLYIACLIIRVQVRFPSDTGADRFFAKAIPFHSMEEQAAKRNDWGRGRTVRF